MGGADTRTVPAAATAVAGGTSFVPDAAAHLAVTGAETTRRLAQLATAAPVLARLWGDTTLTDLLTPSVLHREPVTRALSNDPFFHGAVNGCVTALRAGTVTTARTHLADVVAALLPLVRDRITRPVTLRLSTDGTRGMGLAGGVFTGGPGFAGAPLVIEPGPLGAPLTAFVQGPDGSRVPMTARPRMLLDSRVDGPVHVSDDDQFRRLLRALSEDPDSAAAGHAEPYAYRPEQLDQFPRAFALIEKAWPAMLAEFRVAARVVVPIRSTTKSAFTNTAWQGAVFINEEVSDLLFLVERCVHEASHLRLNPVMSQVPLHLHPWDHRVESPFRPGPRPVTGLYHGAFVFTRVAEVMARLSTDPVWADEAADRVRALLQQITPSLRTLTDEVRLTAAGAALFDEITDVHGRLTEQFPGRPRAVRNSRYLMEEM